MWVPARRHRPGTSAGRLIWGTKDGAVDLRSADALQGALPIVRRHCCRGWGIWHLRDPEGFDRLVLDFLARSD